MSTNALPRRLATARKNAGLLFTQLPHTRHRERREAIQKKQRGL
jgi:hypothetical protein